MSDEEEMALCAIRYCMGRQTYASEDGQRWAREWGARSRYVRVIIIRDIEAAKDRLGGLGDERIDKTSWLDVLKELKAHD